MWELDCEESWAPKNWCFWAVVLEKTLESPLDCKEIQPVHYEGDQPWDFFGRNDAKAETPVLWPPDANSWLIGKTLMLGVIGGRRRRGWQRMRWLCLYHRLLKCHSTKVISPIIIFFINIKKNIYWHLLYYNTPVGTDGTRWMICVFYTRISCLLVVETTEIYV